MIERLTVVIVMLLQRHMAQVCRLHEFGCLTVTASESIALESGVCCLLSACRCSAHLSFALLILSLDPLECKFALVVVDGCCASVSVQVVLCIIVYAYIMLCPCMICGRGLRVWVDEDIMSHSWHSTHVSRVR